MTYCIQQQHSFSYNQWYITFLNMYGICSSKMLTCHSPEIRVLYLIKLSTSERLQNLPDLWKIKIPIIFSVFHILSNFGFVMTALSQTISSSINLLFFLKSELFYLLQQPTHSMQRKLLADPDRNFLFSCLSFCSDLW